jgi:outer membrane receptor protein involved in Fe transport
MIFGNTADDSWGSDMFVVQTVRNLLHSAVITAVVAALLSAVIAPAQAQPAPTAATGTISGTVTDPDGLVIGGADVTLDGPTKAHTRTDSQGAFAFDKVQPGLYQITVSRAAYVSIARTDIGVTAGAKVNVAVALQPSTFTSLQEIGRVSVSSHGGTINTSTASVIEVPAQTFVDQGVPQVTKVLNQTPGIITTISNFGFDNNGAYQALNQGVQIRGGLPYETESLIDGHPVAVGASGAFSPIFLNPLALQGVEVVKGPGSMPNDINYSVGGSVNYRTLEPTRTPHENFMLDYNSYGGISSNFQATGTVLNSRLGYAVDYGITGQNGPFQNDNEWAGTLEFNSTAKINGAPLCGPTYPESYCGGSLGPPGPATTTGYLSLAYPIVICCGPLNSNYTNRTELAKLRYSFSSQTSLTVAFLGAQVLQQQYLSYYFDEQTFNPYNPSYAAFGLWPMPATNLYTGQVPNGFAVPYATEPYFPSNEQVQQGLAESELRTSLGNSTVLFRYYAGAERDVTYQAINSGTTLSFTGQVYGILPVAGGFQDWTGQTATFSQVLGGLSEDITSNYSGESGEIDIPGGNNLYTLSIDRTHQNGYYFFNGTTEVPQGASQAFTTFLARGTFSLSPQVTAMLGNYFVNYSSHYTPDGGVTWADSSHSFFGPRFALTWRTDPDTSVRVSAGSSIAPPFLSLINTAGGPPTGNNQGAVIYYFQTKNNGNILPETAFGYDLGFDHRLAPSLVVSGDVYRTNLHGQFLTTSTANGTYTATSGPNQGKTAPLYITEAANLGESRYEGAELSVRATPPVGFGFVAQGALIRAYAYSLPAGFYNTATGANTTNLGILPGQNFTPTGNGYNGIGERVPYAQGYGELSYHWPNDAFVRLGTTYYGNNNSFNVPPFFDVSASLRYPLGHYASLQVSGENITNKLSSPTGNLFDGLTVPLINGTNGVTTAYNLGPPSYHVTLNLKAGK